MRLASFIQRSLVPILCGLGCIAGLGYVLHAAFAIRECSVFLDPALSSHTHNIVKQSIQSWCADGMGLGRLVAATKNNFPFLTMVSARLVPCGHALVTCYGGKARCRVGDSLVLLESGVLAGQHVFEQGVADLPQVHVAQWCIGREGMPARLPQFLNRIDSALLAQYNITWRGDHDIEFCEHGSDGFTVLTSADRGIDATLLDKCRSVQEKLSDRSAEKWVADVRFRDQIIVFAERMRRGYGTNTF